MLALAILLGLGTSVDSHRGALAQAQRQPECTITVYPGESIQAAIDGAQEGAVVCLGEGTWEENIRIEKSLTLRGVGAERTVIKGIREGYPAVWVLTPEGGQTTSVKVEALMITGATGSCVDKDKEFCSHGVLVQGSTQMRCVECVISANQGAGIQLGGEAWAEITDSTLYMNHCGICLGGSTRLRITGSTISKNEQGLQLLDSAGAKITNCMISNNRKGIELLGSYDYLPSPHVEIIDSTVTGNGDGIDVSVWANADVIGSTISGNGYGVLLTDYSGAEIISSAISGNRDGIKLAFLARANISNSTVSGNRDSGVVLQSLAEAAIADSIISENGQDGILLGDCQVEIKRNTISNNGGYGVTRYLVNCGFEHDELQTSYVSGCGNTIPGPGEENENSKGDACPEDLSFLKEPCESGEEP